MRPRTRSLLALRGEFALAFDISFKDCDALLRFVEQSYNAKRPLVLDWSHLLHREPRLLATVISNFGSRSQRSGQHS